MYKICIFAGTTEARRLVELLSTQRHVAVTACVATEYGETLLPDADNVTVRSGRIPASEIIQLLSDTKYDLVIDATHPYAASITESVARACAETGTEYLRLLREASEQAEDALCVADAEEAAALLSKKEGNILLRDLPDSRLCGIARNIGRAGESCRMLTLGELREAEVDMFCTVLIGNAMTKTIGGRLITPRGYKNV